MVAESLVSPSTIDTGPTFPLRFVNSPPGGEQDRGVGRGRGVIGWSM